MFAKLLRGYDELLRVHPTVLIDVLALSYRILRKYEPLRTWYRKDCPLTLFMDLFLLVRHAKILLPLSDPPQAVFEVDELRHPRGDFLHD